VHQPLVDDDDRIADELTQLSTQLVLNKTVLLEYQNDRTEARRLTTISVGVLLALPMRSPPVTLHLSKYLRK
jgi:hypothetical protein